MGGDAPVSCPHSPRGVVAAGSNQAQSWRELCSCTSCEVRGRESESRVQVSALLWSGCVTLDTFLNLAEPQIPSLLKEDD